MPFTDYDLAQWPRRDHFKLFQGMGWPYFSLNLDVDVTAWYAATREAGLPLFPAMVHRVTATANAVEAFRLRVRGEGVGVHDRVHPSFTVPWRETLFNFCTVEFDPDLSVFLDRCEGAIAHAQTAPTLLLDEPQRDDMIFLSCLPWFAFTGMTHAADPRSGDSIPRISWGRFEKRDGRVYAPFNFQLHHGLADGVHVKQFLDELTAGVRR